MAVIEKTRIQGVGEVLIKFSKRFKRFEIEFTDTELNLHKVDKSLLYADNYSQIETNLITIRNQYLSNELLVKKLIVIKFSTSQSEKGDGGGLLKDSENEKMYHGIGFTLEWFILEQYNIGGKDQYRIIEKSENSSNRIMESPNIWGQIFHGNCVRKLDYSDELYNFLFTFQSSVAKLCNQLIEFFDKDNVKFLENIKTNGLKLLK